MEWVRENLKILTINGEKWVNHSGWCRRIAEIKHFAVCETDDPKIKSVIEFKNGDYWHLEAEWEALTNHFSEPQKD